MSEHCPRAKSDMTPCVVKDGVMALSNDRHCVGCGMFFKAGEIMPDAFYAPAPAADSRDTRGQDEAHYKARHSILGAARYLEDLALGNYEGVLQGVCRTDVLVTALRAAADYIARAARAEGERDTAQDALERIYGETNSANRDGRDPGMLCFSVHLTARDALEALGVLPAASVPEDHK